MVFEVPMETMSIVMDGLVRLNEGDGIKKFFCSFFLPWLKKRAEIVEITNYVKISGQQNGVQVEVKEHALVTEGDKKVRVIKSLKPFSFDETEQFEEYRSVNDVYVVVTTNGNTNTYVVAHRTYPHGKVNWDAWDCRYLPARVGARSDKPLTQKLEIPVEARVPEDDDQPEEKLDDATKQAIAGAEVGTTGKPRGNRKHREAQTDIN